MFYRKAERERGRLGGPLVGQDEPGLIPVCHSPIYYSPELLAGFPKPKINCPR